MAEAASLRETFATSPFARAEPRWCERYHHGHYDAGRGVRFTPSAPAASECRVGADDGTGLACAEHGCDACDCCAGSPCSKVGDPLGNAVIQTTADYPGSRRLVRARFRIERQLPVGESHLALYVALHPHCHTTVQAILVPDRPGVFHLNVAAFNQFIGGDPRTYAACALDSFAAISPALASDVPLAEGRDYRWTLSTRVVVGVGLVIASKVTTSDGRVLASGRGTIAGHRVDHWFGVAGEAARFGFGAQFSERPSSSGREPALRLLAFDADARE